jgi:hypothetical protein
MVNKSNTKTIAQIKEIINDTIGIGIKGVELAMKTSEKFGYNITSKTYFNILVDMVRHGEIIEIEYTTPANPDRIKSFFLPKGSRILTTR